MHRLRLLTAVLALLPVLASAALVTNKEIEEALTCQCGCGLTVHSCNHLGCGSGIPLRQEVAALVAQNLDRDEILLRFRNKYGEKILAAPTTEGFNLTAWTAPFVALLIGTVIVVMAILRWTRRPVEPSEGLAEADDLSSTDRERLERELRKGE